MSSSETFSPLSQSPAAGTSVASNHTGAAPGSAVDGIPSDLTVPNRNMLLERAKELFPNVPQPLSMIVNHETYTEEFLAPEGYSPHVIHFLAGSPYENGPLILRSFYMDASETEVEFLPRIWRELTAMEPNLDPNPPSSSFAEQDWYSVTEAIIDELNTCWNVQQDDEAQLTDYEKRMTQLEVQLSETEETTYGLQSQLGTAHRKLADLQAALDDHAACDVNSLNHATQISEERLQKINRLECSLQSATTKASSQEETIRQSQQELVRLQKRIDSLRKSLEESAIQSRQVASAHKDQLYSLKSQVHDSETIQVELKSRIEAMNREALIDREMLIAQHKEETASLRTYIKSLRNDYVTTDVAVKAARKQESHRFEELTVESNKQREGLENELKCVQEAFVQLEKHEETVRNTLQKTLNENLQLAEDIKSKEAQLEQTKNRKDGLQQSYNMVRAELEKADGERKALRAKNEKTEMQLDLAREHNQSLAAQIETDAGKLKLLETALKAKEVELSAMKDQEQRLHGCVDALLVYLEDEYDKNGPTVAEYGEIDAEPEYLDDPDLSDGEYVDATEVENEFKRKLEENEVVGNYETEAAKE